ncbi:uncharacterized protein LOC131634221 [Vicia villosa]|uniref:uncharacterized protein LOC131634221 n=1 Tax=Vicia villosa TaxID=3911 RepID=UPI00273B5D36|nr:uncharacterized protein LOC131634221 [Vicia villosa]
MGFEYEKIHACPNDCILYRKEYVNYNHCHKCNASRYKQRHGESSDDEEVKKGPPAKVVWYLPIISRFKRLFANADDTKNLRWHVEERKCDGQIRHVASSLQWKKIDSLFPNFGKESRNLRLGLSTDGMNPFVLWEEGMDVFDAHSGEQFNMRAMLFCTINDFAAYGNLSGLRKAFNGEREYGVAPKPLTGEEVYQRQQGITAVFGKYQNRPIVKNIWKKRSVFFDLPYWSSLEARQCIDVMHVEKNVCDSVIGILINIQGKTKDGINARLDLGVMGNKTYLPPAFYTLSKKEKTSFYECLESIKVSHGYSSNVKRLVSVKHLKLVGLKSHDCHVLMQQILPVAIRGILPNNVRKTITRFCLFFNAICCKSIDPLKLEDLENEVVVMLCQLEMFFPPSFFDIMVHLIVHLVREIRLCGPIFLWWMYPIERYMKILKGYTKNPHHPEASIIERYIAEEAIEFCSNYFSEVNVVGVPKSRHDGRCEGVGTC